MESRQREGVSKWLEAMRQRHAAMLVRARERVAAEEAKIRERRAAEARGSRPGEGRQRPATQGDPARLLEPPRLKGRLPYSRPARNGRQQTPRRERTR